MKMTEVSFMGRSPSSISLEKQLWLDNCAACHTNPSNSLPTKIYSTSSDIKNAIIQQDSMRSLSHLTQDEVDLIAKYLNDESLREAQSVTNNLKADSKITIGTTSYLISKLSNLFIGNANSSSNSQVSGIIYRLNNYSGHLGGTCIHLHEICSGNESDNLNAPMLASTSITRKGLLIKSCQEIHDISSVVLNPLEYAELATDSEGSDANLRKFMSVYLAPGTDDRDTILKEIKKIYQSALNSTGSRMEAWKMVSYILCSSDAFEKI